MGTLHKRAWITGNKMPRWLTKGRTAWKLGLGVGWGEQNTQGPLYAFFFLMPCVLRHKGETLNLSGAPQPPTTCQSGFCYSEQAFLSFWKPQIRDIPAHPVLLTCFWIFVHKPLTIPYNAQMQVHTNIHTHHIKTSLCPSKFFLREHHFRIPPSHTLSCERCSSDTFEATDPESPAWQETCQKSSFPSCLGGHQVQCRDLLWALRVPKSQHLLTMSHKSPVFLPGLWDH